MKYILQYVYYNLLAHILFFTSSYVLVSVLYSVLGTLIDSTINKDTAFYNEFRVFMGRQQRPTVSLHLMLLMRSFIVVLDQTPMRQT